MKLMHTTTTTLNTREFNKLSDRIIDSLYELNSEISDLYDIHINYIDAEWKIDFIPLINNIPVIKVETYTDYNDKNQEILRVTPKMLSEVSSELKFRDEDKSYDLCMNYVSVFEFILALYDFEYKLN
jgi:hypothetical protein